MNSSISISIMRLLTWRAATPYVVVCCPAVYNASVLPESLLRIWNRRYRIEFRDSDGQTENAHHQPTIVSSRAKQRTEAATKQSRHRLKEIHSSSSHRKARLFAFCSLCEEKTWILQRRDKNARENELGRPIVICFIIVFSFFGRMGWTWWWKRHEENWQETTTTANKY